MEWFVLLLITKNAATRELIWLIKKPTKHAGQFSIVEKETIEGQKYIFRNVMIWSIFGCQLNAVRDYEDVAALCCLTLHITLFQCDFTAVLVLLRC